MIEQQTGVGTQTAVARKQAATAQQKRPSGERLVQATPPANLTDDALTVALERALSDAGALNGRDANDFTLAVRGGTVVLRGHVLRTSIKSQIERLAGQTRGVLGVENGLVADNELACDVARALIAVTAEHHERLFVNARQGVIDLSGSASSAAVRAAAEQCAANVPHVRAVVNRIDAPNTPSGSAGLRIMQPRVGQEVVGNDMSLGKVESVIISRRNRRVSAIVVRGRFPTGLPASRHVRPGDMPRHERRVVIPSSALRHVNQYDVLLGISGIQAAECAEFNPALFAPADAGWQPPYPYTAADTLREPTAA